jgi:hypothetical protein
MWKQKIPGRWRKYAFMHDDQSSHGTLTYIDERRPMSRDKAVSSSSLGTSATALEDLSYASSHATRTRTSINEDDDNLLPADYRYKNDSPRKIRQLHERLQESDTPMELQRCHESFDDDYQIVDDAFQDSPCTQQIESSDKDLSRQSATGVTWSRAKMVHILSSKSLWMSAELADERNWKSTRGDDLSVIHSVGTYETQESSKRKSIQKGDILDTNDHDNFLARQLELLPSAKLADLVLELERKLKKAKKKKKDKKKKKKSSSSKSRSKRRSSKTNHEDISEDMRINSNLKPYGGRNVLEENSIGDEGSMGDIMNQQGEEYHLTIRSDDERVVKSPHGSKSSRRKSLPELEILSLRGRGDFPSILDDMQFRSLDLTPWGHLGFDDTSSDEEDD